MSKSTWRTVCLLVALLMLAACLQGCGTGNTAAPAASTVSSTATTAPTQTESPTQPADTVKPVEPITFTAYSADSSVKVKWGEDPISQEITKETGVSMDIEYDAGGDASQKIGIMMASDSLPDIILSIQNSDVAKLIDGGQLVALDDYITKEGVNVKKVFGDKIDRMKYEKDGKIYGFNREWDSQPLNSPVQINVQIAVLKEAGYPKITTLDDLYNLIKDYKAKHPQINGQDTIGVESWGDSYGWSTTINNAALRTAGSQDNGDYIVDPNTYQAKLGITTDAAKTYFKWLNKLYNDGLYDPESLIQKRDMFAAKVSSGRVLVTTDAYWDLGSCEAALRQAGMPERCYAKIPLYSSEDAAANSHINDYDPSGSWKTVIAKSCKDPERAFIFFDTMWSTDMQVLCNWGIKDVNYTVDASGNRVMKDEFVQMYANDKDFRSKTGLTLYPYWSVGYGVKDSTGNYIVPWNTPEMISAQYTDQDKECLHAYKPDAVTWTDLCPTPEASPYGFEWTLTLPSDTEGAIAEQKIDNEIRIKAVPQIVMSKTDADFEANWNSFLKQCSDAGIAKREEEIDNAIKARMQLWGTAK